MSRLPKPAQIALSIQHHGAVLDQLAQLGAAGIVDELDFLAVLLPESA